MPKEPGRNELCWCGSGKKYKKCHLKRASEKDLPFEALVQEMQEAWDQKKCMHPQAAAGVCDRIVSAHTIQRSRVLQRITDSSNHVRSFHPLKPDFSTGRFELRRIGWPAASTFTGFCGKHDSATFKPLEETDFTGSPEQCFLIGYRAHCHVVVTGADHMSFTDAHLVSSRFTRDMKPDHSAFERALITSTYTRSLVEEFLAKYLKAGVAPDLD